MKQTEPPGIQPEESEKILLTVNERHIEAYGEAAYILYRCFPHFVSLQKETGKNGNIYFVEMDDWTFLSGNKNFRLMGNDDLLELYFINPKLKMKLPGWIHAYQQLLKEEYSSGRNEDNSFPG